MTDLTPGRKLNEFDFKPSAAGAEMYGEEGGTPYRLKVGEPNGLPHLDGDGLIPADQVPGQAGALRADLASTTSGKGDSLVFPQIEALTGIDPTGVTLSDTGFATAAALGRTIKLRPGATYYLSQRVNFVTGTRFICDGICTVKLKTGAGGYNHTNLNTNKDTNAVFYMSAVDDVGVEGVRFTTDGVKEVCIYPIRINAGCATKGADVHRIEFYGLSAISGGYFSKNSIGAGGVRWSDIKGVSCGTAQGNTYWTGTPQISVDETDNDLVGGVHSVGNALFGRNVGAKDVLLTGQALTDYGQETDVVNVAGISGTDRKGPTITGIWADGVGEVLDVFCGYGSFHISRAKNVHKFVAKAIHGAHGNSIEVDNIESCGLAAVVVAGSASLAVHTANNYIHVRNCFGVGDSGTGPSSSDTCAVLIQENGGAIGTCLPRSNTIVFDNFVPGANTDYAVKDNCAVNNSNGNRVIFERAPTGMGTAFGTVVQEANIQVVVKDRARVEACLSAAQNGLTTATDTTVAFAEVITDRQSQFNTGTNTARMKYPGEYGVRVSVRTVLNASDNVITKIFKNGTAVCQSASEPVSGGLEYTYIATKTVTIGVNDAGAAAADLLAKVNITSAGAINLLDTNSMTFFEINPAG